MGAPAGYGRVARWLHWLIAALAVVVVVLGWAMAAAPRNTPPRDLLMLLHRSVGLTILAAMLFRLLWRFGAIRRRRCRRESAGSRPVSPASPMARST